MARKSGGLGERHYKIIEFMSKFQDANHYSPSIREIGESIGVNSTSLVDYYLKQLEDLRYIERDNRVSRSIRILHPLRPTLGERVSQAARKATTAVNELLTVPVVGRIVASAPIPVPASDLSYFDPETSVGNRPQHATHRERLSELFAWK